MNNKTLALPLNDLRELIEETKMRYPRIVFCSKTTKYPRVDRETWARHLRDRAAYYGLTWWAEAA